MTRLHRSIVLGGGDFMHNLRTRAGAIVALVVVSVLASASAAVAAPNGAAVDGVETATATLKDTIQAGIPLILIVAVVWVVLSMAKRLVKKAG